MHFLHTSSILSVSFFEIARSALAKRYAHCCFARSDACRSGGVKKIGIGAPTHYESGYLFVIGAERGDANSGIRRHLPCGNLVFDNAKILKLKKK